MGIDLYIEDEQIRLTNSYWYNEFLNWVAQMIEGDVDFPNILEHSPNHGQYLLDKEEPPTMYSGSVQNLKKELQLLLTYKPPEYAKDIIDELLRACGMSIKEKEKITMDGGAFFGD